MNLFVEDYDFHLGIVNFEKRKNTNARSHV
jgi:hypothetical protein